MMVPLLLVLAIGLDVDIRRVALLAAVAYLPELVAVGIALVVWRGRPGEDTRTVMFCEAVASELRAGSTLRQAVTGAAVSVGGLSVSPEQPLDDLAASVAVEFPQIGDELRLTLVGAGRTGSDAAGLFDEIGALALAQSEIRREVAVATAPGRATALVLVGAPIVYILTQAGSGGIASLLVSPQQRVVALIGLGLFLVGLGGALAVVARAGR